MKLEKPTRNYGQFSYIFGNRDINKVHVARLVKSFKEKVIPEPIIVDELLQIINGQHRFEAMKELGLEVHYIIIPGLDINDVHRLNTNTKSWSSYDYARSYADGGNIDYQTYLQFKEKYKLPHTLSIKMLSGGVNCVSVLFYNGLFKIKNYNKAMRDADKITKTGEFFKYYKNTSYANALLEIFEMDNFDYQTLIARMKVQTERLTKQADKECYVHMIVGVYNHGTLKINKLSVIL